MAVNQMVTTNNNIANVAEQNWLEVLTEDTIKKQFCNKATQQELIFAAQYCKINNLNPWKKECYFVKYGENDPLAIITAYEVALKRAEDFPQYDGYESEFTGTGNNLQCTCKVYRKDRRVPVKHTAYYSESLQTKKDGTPNKFWKKQPRFMLEKCAIANALKKAFPKNFTGMNFGEAPEERLTFEETYSPPVPTYNADELLENLQNDDMQIESNKKITQAQITRLFARASELKLTTAEVKQMLIAKNYITIDPIKQDYSTSTMLMKNYEEAFEALNELAWSGVEGQEHLFTQGL